MSVPHRLALETPVHASTDTRVHDIAELLRREVEELLEGDSTVGVGAEGALLLDLGSRGRILIPESELLTAVCIGSLAYSVSAMLSVWDVIVVVVVGVVARVSKIGTCAVGVTKRELSERTTTRDGHSHTVRTHKLTPHHRHDCYSIDHERLQGGLTHRAAGIIIRAGKCAQMPTLKAASVSSSALDNSGFR